jgi:hypothetical protein
MEAIMELYHREATGEVAVQDDPQARELLRRAYATTYRWPKGFAGFRANLFVNNNGQEVQGSVVAKLPDAITISLSDADLQKWAQNQIAMMAIHRGPRTFEESDGRFTLTLAEADAHPQGQCILIHGDGMNSRYRVRDDHILQVTRTMHGMKFTINVQAFMTVPDGKSLTTQYTVYYFAPQENRLTQAESFTDKYCPVGDIYLPETRTILLSQGGDVVTRVLRFEDHKLL